MDGTLETFKVFFNLEGLDLEGCYRGGCLSADVGARCRVMSWEGLSGE